MHHICPLLPWNRSTLNHTTSEGGLRDICFSFLFYRWTAWKSNYFWDLRCMIIFKVNNIWDLYFARQYTVCFTYMIHLIFTQPYEVHILIYPLQLRKLRFRIWVGNFLSYTIRRWQKWRLKPHLLIIEPEKVSV